MGELEQIALIKQTLLQRPALKQRSDLAALECGDPAESFQLPQLPDRPVRDHAPIPDEQQPLEPEALAQLAYL